MSPPSSRARRWLPAVLGIALPGLVALAFVQRFAVDVPSYDEWNFMPTVEAFYSGGDWWSMVVQHYGEHRIVLPRLVILFLSLVTDLDVRVEELLAALFMLGAAVVCWSLLRRTGGPRWAIVPVGWLILSTAQFENLLVGWQFQVPMMSFFALCAITLLAGDGRWRGAAAALCGVAATFSFANGMAVWPAGLVAIAAAAPGTRRRRLAVWSGTAVAAAVAYRWGYQGFDRPPAGYELAVFRHPWNAARMFVALAGNNFGAGTIPAMTVAGVVVLTLSAVVLVGLWRLRRGDRRDLPWLALGCFGMLSVAAVTLGRSFVWERMVTPSRFLTVAMFLPVALVVLASRCGVELWGRGGWRRAAVAAGALLLAAAAVLQQARGVELGWEMGAAHRALKLRTLPCLLHYRSADVECLRGVYVADGELVRERAATLERWRLGPFADPVPAAFLAADGGAGGRAPLPPAGDAAAPDLRRMEGTFEFVGRRSPAGATNVVEQGERVVAEGWALTPGLESPAAVVLTVDGAWVAATASFVPRRDVDRFFHRATAPCAWRFEIGTEGLEPGEHRLQALALPAGATAPRPVPGDQTLVVRAPGSTAGAAADARAQRR